MHSMVLLLAGAAQAQGVVYKCPGPPILYTDALSAKEAQEKGCKAIDGAPITVIQAQRPRVPASSSTKDGSRVDAQAQAQRDDDRRKVLQDELNSAQAKLAELQQQYNGGNPERQGDERNYQKYLDRVADMKAAIARQQSDIEAIKNELAKLP